MSLCALPAAADPLPIVAQVTANGPAVTIGTLQATLTNPPGSPTEAGTFTLNQQFRNVMSDANGDQFRYFQVITQDSQPALYNGVAIPSATAANHTDDAVDTPSGGWDYEKQGDYAASAGDDTLPFYETNTTANAGGTPWAFPTLNYVALHSADGANPGYSSTNDSPGLSGNNQQTLFETFITYENPTLMAAQIVDIIGGYSWGIQTNGTGTVSTIAPTYIPYSSITDGMLAEFETALANSGFQPGGSGWAIESSDVILNTLAPEPSGLVLLGLGAMALAAASRRRMRKLAA